MLLQRGPGGVRRPTPDAGRAVPMERGVYFHIRKAPVRWPARLSLHPSVSGPGHWTRPGRVSVAGLVLACLLLVACLPVILTGTTRGRAAYDSLNYHEKAVRQFAQELPKPLLNDYLSATTPGYHLVLAVVGRAAGIGADGRSAYETNLTPAPPDRHIEAQRRVLLVTGLGFSLALVYLIGHWSERRIGAGGHEPGPALAAVCLALPLIGSPYLYQSAAWLLPDNSAWLGVAAILLLALRPRAGVVTLTVMGAVLVCLVLSRQVHLWAAGLVWAAAWLSASLPADRVGGPLLSSRDLFAAGRAGAVAGRLSVAVLCTIPAFAVLGWFWSMWNRQLVPPTFTSWHRAGVQGATPAFILGLFAVLAPFFGGWLWAGLQRAWRDHRGWVLGAATAGLLLAVVPASAWDFDNGRFGGVWQFYRRAGDIAGRSLALMVLAPVGAAAVVAALAEMSARRRWVMLGALVGFALANSANPQLWQRYHEPFVLLWLIVASALSAGGAGRGEEPGPIRPWKLAGPVVLALIMGVVSVAMVAGKKPEHDKMHRLGVIETPPHLVPPSERPK
ncbi:MAG TPA: hypothetical protein VEB22_04115 [Phycisphaerales bacterium]|nr:hypothetical protein [Phycisphaerales bacterium]